MNNEFVIKYLTSVTYATDTQKEKELWDVSGIGEIAFGEIHYRSLAQMVVFVWVFDVTPCNLQGV